MKSSSAADDRGPLHILSLQHPFHGDGAPVPAMRGRDAAAVQPVSDLAQRRTASLHGQDDGEQVGGPLGSMLGSIGRHRGVAAGAPTGLNRVQFETRNLQVSN
jgi:hypothetical protein